jgi:biotin carboxyl carrier protein
MGETILLRDQWGGEYQASVQADGRVRVGDTDVTVDAHPDGSVRIHAGHGTPAWATISSDRRWVFLNGEVFTFEVDEPARVRRRSAAHQGSLTAPMPAMVRKIVIEAGAAVRRGDVLIVLEAMKMELPVRAPSDGIVARINCREGEMVQAGQELAEIAS